MSLLAAQGASVVVKAEIVGDRLDALHLTRVRASAAIVSCGEPVHEWHKVAAAPVVAGAADGTFL